MPTTELPYCFNGTQSVADRSGRRPSPSMVTMPDCTTVVIFKSGKTSAIGHLRRKSACQRNTLSGMALCGL